MSCALLPDSMKQGKDAHMARRSRKDRNDSRVDAKARAKSSARATVSGIRGIGSGIIGTVLANQVRASAGKAGIAGVAAGLAFNILLKRSPVGAVLFGGAILARQAMKSGKEAQARRDAKKALEKGAMATPGDSTIASLHPAPV